MIPLVDMHCHLLAGLDDGPRTQEDALEMCRIAYADEGDGPAALFVHGVFLNADLWRNAIAGVKDIRRCIAVDLPAHGQSPATDDMSLPALAILLAGACGTAVAGLATPRPVPRNLVPDKIGSFTPYDKNGCRECNDRGYRGRVAVYEVMPFWDGLKELVINGASAAELKQEAIRLGMQTLRMSALNKVMGGITTIEEAVANTAPDRF